jgi:hypothetical protein
VLFGQANGLVAVGGFGDNRHVGLALKQGAQAIAHHGMVVSQ